MYPTSVCHLSPKKNVLSAHQIVKQKQVLDLTPFHYQQEILSKVVDKQGGMRALEMNKSLQKVNNFKMVGSHPTHIPC